MTVPPTHAPVPATDRPLVRLVRRHPLTTFFTLAYLGSWLLWLPYILGPDGLGVLPGIALPELLGNTQLAGVLPGAYIGPLGAAFLVTAIAGGRPALRAWRHRLAKWRVGVPWYLLALIGVPAVMVTATLALPDATADIRLPGLEILAMYLPMLLIQIITTGLAEEPGWRDFALPIVQYRYGPTRGTALLGALWAVWHFPLFGTQWSYAADRLGRPEWFVTVGVFTASCFMISFVITWVFNRTGQSLPVAMVLHAGVNNTASVLLPVMFPALPANQGLLPLLIAFSVAGVVVLAGTRGRLGYRRPGISPEPSQG